MNNDTKQRQLEIEELVKTADSFIAFFSNLANELSKVLADVKVPDEEENTWEMKCPYEYGDKHYCIQSSGDVFSDSWRDIEADNRYFSQGNVFTTKQAAELESKRRGLLTRFRAFRDECNDGWKPDWSDSFNFKHYLEIIDSKVVLDSVNCANRIATFGYFKYESDAERAIELFGDEIKELFVDCEGR